MTTSGFALWIVCVLVCAALLYLIQIPLRKLQKKWPRIIVLIAKFLLCVFIAFAVMAIDAAIVYRFTFVLSGLYVALFGDIVGDIISLFIENRGKPESRRKRQFTAIAICTVIYLLAGTINMQVVTPHAVNITTDKVQKTHKFVFFADIQVGSSQSMKTVEETIRKIDNEDPEFVLIGGDNTDELTTNEEMKQLYALLGTIDAPVYFIYGNHDYQPTGESFGGRTYTQEELEEALASNGINVLKDEWIEWDDNIVLFGRDDYTSPDRKPIEAVPARPEGSFVIAVDHSPYETEDIIKSGADIQLSGHSHAGQFFPLQALYRLAGYDAYGKFHHGDTDVFVTSGAGGWGVPFRTEAGCHYEVVTLEPGSQGR